MLDSNCFTIQERRDLFLAKFMYAKVVSGEMNHYKLSSNKDFPLLSIPTHN